MYNSFEYSIATNHGYGKILMADESVTEFANYSVISAACSCLDIFRFTLHSDDSKHQKIMISLWAGMQGELQLSRLCLSSQRWAFPSFSLSLILLHAAILTLPEWQARGRGWKWRPWWRNRYTHSWETASASKPVHTLGYVVVQAKTRDCRNRIRATCGK